MRLARLSVFLALPLLLAGCATATAPIPPVAPGYLSAADQTLGESLAAVNAFVTQEKVNYAQETATAQATEKPYLNGLITAVDLANAAYVSYHSSPTAANLTAAQNALTNAQTAQAALAKSKGVS